MSFKKEMKDSKYYLIGSALATFLIAYVMNPIHSVTASPEPSASIAWDYNATTAYQGDAVYSKDVCGCTTFPTNAMVSTKLSVFGMS